MVTTLVSLLYFVMTLSMIIINSSNMSIHGDSRALFHPNGPGGRARGGKGVRAPGNGQASYDACAYNVLHSNIIMVCFGFSSL